MFGSINTVVLLKEFVSLTIIAMEMGKKALLQYHSNSCKVGKILHQKHESFTFELPTTKLHFLDKYKKCCNLKKDTFSVKRPKC